MLGNDKAVAQPTSEQLGDSLSSSRNGFVTRSVTFLSLVGVWKRQGRDNKSRPAVGIGKLL